MDMRAGCGGSGKRGAARHALLLPALLAGLLFPSVPAVAAPFGGMWSGGSYDGGTAAVDVNVQVSGADTGQSANYILQSALTGQAIVDTASSASYIVQAGFDPMFVASTTGGSYLGPTWYVSKDTGSDDTGTGSSLSPFRTVTKGCTMATTGDTVYLYEGVFDNESAVVRSDSVTVYGQGTRTTVLARAAKSALTCTGRIGVRINNIAVSSPSGNGITCTTSVNMLITNVTCTNVGCTGIYLGVNSDRNTIDGCTFDSVVTGITVFGDSVAILNVQGQNIRNTGIYMIGADSCWVSGNRFLGPAVNGINVTGAYGSRFFNNLVKNCSNRAMYIQQTARSLVVDSCDFRLSSEGVTVWGDSNEIRSCYIGQCTTYGLFFFGGDTNRVYGNTVTGGAGRGIVLQDGQFNNIYNNLITSNGSDGFWFFSTRMNRVYSNRVAGNGGYAFYVFSAVGTDSIVKNNVSAGSNPDSLVYNQMDTTLDFRRNWWGTRDSVVIRRGIVGSRDSRVVYTPFRLGEVDTTIGADTIAPKAPDTVAVQIAGVDTVLIAWKPVTVNEEIGSAASDFLRYRVYRALTPDSNSWQLLGETTGLRFYDTIAYHLYGPRYFYRVTTIDNKSGLFNEAFWSDSVADTIPAYNGPIWYVSRDTGSDTTYGYGSQRLPFAGIQRGLNFAGKLYTTETVFVYTSATAYPESLLTFPRDSVTLQGALRNDSTRWGVRVQPAASSVVTPSTRRNLIIRDLAISAPGGNLISFSNVDLSRIEGCSLTASGAANGISLSSGSDSNVIYDNWIDSASGSSGRGITLDGSSNCLIDSNLITRNRYFPFYALTTRRCTVVNNVLRDNPATTQVALFTNNSDTNFISGNRFENNGVRGSFAVTFILNNANVFYNNVIDSCRNGINIWSNAHNGVIDSNTITRITDSVGIRNEGGDSWLISRNLVDSVGGYGHAIFFSDNAGAQYCLIRNNWLRRTGSYGISIAIGNHYNVVRENRIETTSCGIKVSGSNHISLESNAVVAASDGIQFQNSNYCTIAFNACTRAAGAFWLVTSSNCRVFGNTFFNGLYYGYYEDGGSANHVFNNLVDSNGWGGMYFAGAATTPTLIYQNRIQNNRGYALSYVNGDGRYAFKNNISGGASNPDSLVYYATSVVSQGLWRNWFGTTDSAAIRRGLAGNAASVVLSGWQPFRLGEVDTNFTYTRDTSGRIISWTSPDTIAPKAPDTVAAVYSGLAGGVVVSWKAVQLREEGPGFANDSMGYRVYKSLRRDTSYWRLVHETTTLASAPLWVDTAFIMETGHYYRVTCFDTKNPFVNQSFYSDSIAACTPAYAGPIWYVSKDTGNDGSGTGSETKPFKTIYRAINRSSANETVYIYAQTYSESIVITKDSLTIMGAQRGTVFIQPGATISAVNATNRYNLDIANLTCTGVTDNNPAFYFDGTRNSRVSGLIFVNVNKSIYALNSDTNVFRDNVISQRSGDVGNPVDLSGNANVFDSNLVSGFNTYSEQVLQSSGDSVHITNNIIRDISMNNSDGAALLDIQGNSDRVLVAGNSIYSVSSPYSLTVVMTGVGNNGGWHQIQNNVIDSIVGRGIWLVPTNSTIDSNVLSRITRSAITVWSDTTTISRNTINGIARAYNRSVGLEVYFSGWLTCSGNVFNRALLKSSASGHTPSLYYNNRVDSVFGAAFQINPGAATTNLIIDSNHLTNCGSTFSGEGLFDASMTINAADSILVRNNVVESGAGAAIYLYGVDSSTISGNRVFHNRAGSSRRYGIELSSVQHDTVYNNVVDSAAYGILVQGGGNGAGLRVDSNLVTRITVHGITHQSTRNGAIVNNRVETAANASNYYALYLNGSESTTVDNNRVSNVAGNAIYVEQPGVNSPNWITNNIVDSSARYGIYTRARRTTVDSNIVSRVTYSGIHLAGADSCDVTRNVVYRASTGIYAWGDSVNVRGNRISDPTGSSKIGIQTSSSNDNDALFDNVIDSSGWDYGLYLASTGATIESNAIAQAHYGIYANGAFGGARRCTFTSNVVETSTTSSFYLNVACTNVVRNNIFRRTSGNWGAALSDAHGNVIQGNLWDNVSVTGFSIVSSNQNVVSGNTVRVTDPTRYAMTHAGTASGNVVTKNNLLGTLLVANYNANPLDVRRNWFGITDSQALKSKITTPGGGAVTYIPYRLGEVDTAFLADTVAPKVPDTVATTVVSSTSCTVSWSSTPTADEEKPAQTGFLAYRVYRASQRDSSNWLFRGQTSGTSFLDSGLSSGQTVWYRLTAVDTKTPYENEAFWSETAVSVTPTADSISGTYRLGIALAAQFAADSRTSVSASAWTVPAAVGGGFAVYAYCTSTLPALRAQLIDANSQAETGRVMIDSGAGWVASGETILVSGAGFLDFTPQLVPGVNSIRFFLGDTSGTGLVADDSRTASIYVDATLPLAPALSSPAAGLKTSTSGLTFTWGSSQDTQSGLNRHVLELSRSIDFTGARVAETSTLYGTSQSVTLQPNDTYYWRVAAYDTAGNVAYSETRVFWVDTTQPAPPTYIYPSAYAETNAAAIGFDWTDVTDSVSGFSHYRLQVSSSVSFAGPLPVDTSLGTVSEAAVVMAEGAYYWRVLAYDSAGNASNSDSIRFVVDRTAPIIATVTFASNRPAYFSDGAGFDTTAASDTIWFNNAAAMGAGQAVTVTVTTLGGETSVLFPQRFGDVALLDGVAPYAYAYTLGAAYVTDTTMVLTAADTAGNASTATVHWGRDVDSASRVNLLSPVAAKLLYGDTTPTLSWTASTDTQSGLRGYVVQITWEFDSLAFATPVQQAGILSGVTSYTTTPLEDSSARYFWRVITVDSTGNADTSTADTQSFRVDSRVPSLTGFAFATTASGSFWDDTPVLVNLSGDTVWFSSVGAGANQVCTIIARAKDGDANDSVFFGSMQNGAFTVVIDTTTRYTTDTYLHVAYLIPTGAGDERITVVVYDADGNRDTAVLAFVADTNPPTAPVLVSPANPLDTRSQVVRFSWAASVDTGVGVKHYRLQVDTTGTWTTAGIDTTLRDLGAWVTLPTSDTYRWRVMAVDTLANEAASETGVLVFDTIPPTAPGLVAPAAEHETSATGILFSWTGSTDALSGFKEYRLQIHTSDDFASPSVDSVAGTVTSALRTLRANDTWYWRVVAVDDAGNTVAQAARILVVDTVAPQAAALLAPAANHETNVPQFTFRWTTGSDTLSGLAYHRLQVCTSSAFSAPLAGDSNVSDAVTGFLALVANDTYWWRVVTYDSASNSTVSESRILVVDTLPPTAPAQELPAANSDTTVTSVLFRWTASTDTGAGFLRYRLMVDTAGTFVSLYADSYTTETQATVYLPVNDTYYWRVLAYDELGQNYVFGTRRVRVDTLPPVVSSPLFPTEGLETNLVNMPFSWTPGADSIVGIRYNRIQVDTEADFSGALVHDTNIFTGPYPDSTVTLILQPYTYSYYWRVVSYDTVGNATFGDPVRFRIDAETPTQAVLLTPDERHDTTATQFTVTWTSSSDTTQTLANHRLQVGTDSTFAGGIRVDSYVGLSTSETIAVPANDTYFWRVLAYDSTGNVSFSSVRHFIVDTNAPNVPTLVTPGVNLDTLSVSIVFSWLAGLDTGAGIDSYILQVDTEAAFTLPLAVDSDNATSLTRTIDLASDSYFWRVIARDGAGNHDTTAARFLRVDYQAPNRATLSDPTDTHETSNVTIAFRWGLGNDTVLGVWLSRLEISSTNDFATVLYYDTRFAGVYPETTVTRTLPANARYYWRVVTEDSVGNRNNGDVYSVKVDTAPPTPAIPQTPSQGYESSATSVVFTWLSGTETVTPPIRFRIQVGRDSTFAGSIVADTWTGYATTQTMTLLANDTYWWRIVSYDSVGNHDTSIVMQMAVDTLPPTQSILVYPAQLAETNSSPTAFSWASGADSIAGVSYYQVQVNGASDFSGTSALDTTVYGTALTQQLGETSYWWRVRAVDEAGNIGAWSTGNRFLVDYQVPLIRSVTIVSGTPTFFYNPGGIDTVAREDTVWFRNAGAGSGQAVTVVVGYSLTGSLRYPQHFGEAGVTYPESTPAVYVYTLEAGLGDTVMHLATFDTATNSDTIRVNWISDVTAPSAALITPLDNGFLNESQPLFTWGAAVDTQAGTSGYTVQISKAADFSTIDTTSGLVTDTSWRSQTLPDSFWYWRVVTMDSVGNADTASATVRILRVDRGFPVFSGYRITSSVDSFFFDDTPVLATREGDTVWYNPNGAGANQVVTIVVHITDGNESAVNGSPVYTPLTQGDTGANKDTYTLVYRIPTDAASQTLVLSAVDIVGLIDTAALLFTKDSEAPVMGALIGPMGGYEDSRLTQLFTWVAAVDTGSGLRGYRFQADPTGLFAPPTVDSWVGTDTRCTATLPANFGWYWRIVAVDRVGVEAVSDSLRIILDTAPPIAGALIAPVNYDTTGTRLDFSWNLASDTGAGVANYQLQVSRSETFAVVDTNLALGEATWRTLTFSTIDTHWWRVIVTDDVGNTVASTAGRFIIDTNVPTQAALVAPVNAHDTRNANVTFSWQTATDTGCGLVNHRLQIDRTPTFAGPVFDSNCALGTTATASLGGNDTYWWRVISYDKLGNLQVSESRSLRIDTQAPTGITLTAPESGAALVDFNPIFIWTSPVDTIAGLANFRLQLDTTGTFAYPALDTNVDTRLTVTITVAAEGVGAYFWRVIATDNVGNGAVSESRYFVLDLTPPTPGTVLKPADAFETNARKHVFAWTAASDSQSGISRYVLQMDTTPSFTQILFESVAGNVTSCTARLPFGNDTWFWRVKVYDLAGNAAYCTTSWICYDTQAPDTPLLLAPVDRLETTAATQRFRWRASYDSGVQAWNATSELAYYRLQVARADSTFTAKTVDVVIEKTVTETTPLYYFTIYDTYYWRVQAYDEVGNVSTSPYFIFYRPGAGETVPPDPVVNLRGRSLETAAVLVEWEASPSPDVVEYLLYWDSVVGTAPDTLLAARVHHTLGETFSAISPVLWHNAEPRFRVDAVDSAGNLASAWVTVRVDTTVYTVPAAQFTPTPSGLKIRLGEQAQLTFTIPPESAALVTTVLFQYRVYPAGPWTDMLSAPNVSGQANPYTRSASKDELTEYRFVWNSSVLPSDTYEVRIVTTSSTGETHASTGLGLRIVNPLTDSPTFFSNATTESFTHYQMIHVNRADTITVTSNLDTMTATVHLVSGAYPNANDTNNVYIICSLAPTSQEDNRIRADGVLPGVVNYAVFDALVVRLSNGDSLMAAGRTCTVTMSFRDDNQDGFVDGTMIRWNALRILAHTGVAGEKWTEATYLERRDPTATTAGYIRALTNHFSIFRLVGPGAQNDLNNLVVAPNPFRPNDNSAGTGQNWTGAVGTGVYFLNLPMQVRIQVYTVIGRKVFDYSTTQSTGQVQWDVRNEAGQDVASGVYVYIVTDLQTNQRVSGKLAVIR